MERVGEHPVPAGPLAIRWLAYDLPELRAGVPVRARLVLENAGTATWRSRGDAGIQLSHHWLDRHGNPIVWDGPRVAFAAPVAPGERVEREVELAPPCAPGPYRLAFELVEEYRFWFSEIGIAPLEVDVDVRPRIGRRLGVALHGVGDPAATQAALAAQDEALVDEEPEAVAHLVAGAVPAPDWARLVLDAHQEGYAAVGGSVEASDRRLRPWAPGGGRKPGFDAPLLLPSLVRGLEPGEHLGLPAHHPADAPWIYDGRIRLRLPRGRRPA